MASLPVLYPHIPFLGSIGGLHHGRMIRIAGEALHRDWLRIDIKTGAVVAPSDDINLHLSVRPNNNAIVRNHMVRHEWGPEERLGGCPIQYGQKFEILILAETEQFKIAVNGRHFCEFRHRIPLSTARFIHVEGQVKIHSIKVEGDPYTMAPSAPILPIMTMTMTAPTQSYQPPYQPQYQPPPPMQQHHHQHHLPQQPHMPYAQPSPYGSLSANTIAVPSNPNQTSFPSGQYSTPQHTYYYQQPSLSSLPYQQYPSYHTYHTNQSYVPQKSSTGSKALKYAAGIGGVGLGAYAISKIFESDHCDSD